jgi:Tetratricopeptide repeat
MWRYYPLKQQKDTHILGHDVCDDTIKEGEDAPLDEWTESSPIKDSFELYPNIIVAPSEEEEEEAREEDPNGPTEEWIEQKSFEDLRAAPTDEWGMFRKRKGDDDGGDVPMDEPKQFLFRDDDSGVVDYTPNDDEDAPINECFPCGIGTPPRRKVQLQDILVRWTPERESPFDNVMTETESSRQVVFEPTSSPSSSPLRTRNFTGEAPQDELLRGEKNSSFNLGRDRGFLFGQDRSPSTSRGQMKSGTLTVKKQLGTSPPGSFISIDDVTEEVTGTSNSNEAVVDENDLISEASSTIGPMLLSRRPLLLLGDDSLLDEASSSDETPVASNGKSNKRRVSQNINGEKGLLEYRKKHQQLIKEKRRLQRIRQRYEQRNQKMKRGDGQGCTSTELLLPPLVIDPEHLHSFGVKAIMSVCNGIGSLFLPSAIEQSSSSPPKKSREHYQKLKPEKLGRKSSGRKTEVPVSRSSSVRNTDRNAAEKRRQMLALAQEAAARKMSSAGAVYFKEAFQKSIEACPDDENLATSRVQARCSTSVPMAQQPTHFFSTKKAPNTPSLSLLEDRYEMKRTQSLPVSFPRLSPATDNNSRNVDAVMSKQQKHRTSNVTAVADPAKSPSAEASNDDTDGSAWSLAREIEKKHLTLSSMSPLRVSERIVIMRNGGSDRSSANSVSAAADRILQELSEIEASFSDFNSKKNHDESFDVDESPSAVLSDSEHPDDEIVYDTITPVKNLEMLSKNAPATATSGDTVALTPLSGPPDVRRFSIGTDLIESLSSHSQGEEELEEEIVSVGCLHGNTPQKSNTEDKRNGKSPRHSPMSDFLAGRILESNGPNQSFGNVLSPERADEDGRSASRGSDESSTGELLSGLDDMMRDLDDLASVRRSERSVALDSSFSGEFSSAFPSFSVSEAAILRVIAQDSNDDEESDGEAHGNMPAVIAAIDNDIGVAKGDIVLSLLNNAENDTWTSRVDEAIWRCRSVRHQFDTLWIEEKSHRKSGPSQGRTSVCVDVDDVRVVGGIESISNTERAAVEHLKYEDFDDALALFEDISLSYELIDEGSLDSEFKSEYVKVCRATALHNLGIIHLLRGEHEEALSYFDQAKELREFCLGESHPDYIVRLCLVAMSCVVVRCLI